MYRKFTIGIVTMIFGAVLVVGCDPSTSLAPAAQPIAEQINTLSPIPTITPTGTATPSPTSAENATPTSTPTVTPTATSEVEKIEDLFPTEWLMESENLKVKISIELMNVLNLKSVEVDPSIMENVRKLILSRWSWKLSQADKENSKLDPFRDLDQKDGNAMKNAFDSNAALGDKGFNYEFNFGRGAQSEDVVGIVDKFEIRTVSSYYKSWEGLTKQLRENGINYRIMSTPNGKSSLVYFDKTGIFQIIQQDRDDKRYPEFVPNWLILQLTLPQVNGEYVIGEETANNGSVSDPVAIFDEFGCGEGNDYCKTAASNSKSVFQIIFEE